MQGGGKVCERRIWESRLGGPSPPHGHGYPEELPAPKVQPEVSAWGPTFGTYSDNKRGELDRAKGSIKFDLW